MSANSYDEFQVARRASDPSDPALGAAVSKPPATACTRSSLTKRAAGVGDVAIPRSG